MLRMLCSNKYIYINLHLLKTSECIYNVNTMNQNRCNPHNPRYPQSAQL